MREQEARHFDFRVFEDRKNESPGGHLKREKSGRESKKGNEFYIEK
ncbi:24891_t:CDS:2 [Gigaspora margarita]|uniref:24891_t:CDS:1 n=1 Tax=Gigaspora margarita TaxID=4874 RepID=A0ABN7VJ16_GIGMA|nr:24891_t:CDS:2 [Gigaspora margarita]